MPRLTAREIICCTAFGIMAGLVIRPRSRIPSPLISHDDIRPTIIAIVLSVAVSLGVYLWLVRRERN